MRGRRGRLTREAGWVAAGVLLFVLVGAPAHAGEPSRADFADTDDFPTVRIVFTPASTFRESPIDSVTVFQDGVRLNSNLTALRLDPVEVVLLIDTSGSMAGDPITQAQQAAIGFIQSLPAGSKVAVLGFGEVPTISADFSSSPDEVIAAVSGLQASGGTAIHDSVITAVEALELESGTRQFIVLLSDGGDTSSAASLDDVVTALTDTTVGFYAIELQGSELDSAALAAMGDAAGGLVVSASDASGLAAIYSDIAAEVVSQYVVEFEAAHGGTTEISIVLRSGVNIDRIDGDYFFPTAAGETTPVTLAPAAAREITPAPSRVGEGPSTFERKWALNFGIAALFLTLLVILGFALQPVTEETRRSALSPLQSDPFDRPRRRFRRVARAAQSRFEDMRRRGTRSKLDIALEAAGIALTPGEYVVAVAAGAIVGLAIGILTGSLLAGLVLMALIVILPRIVLGMAGERRRNAFADQLEGTLLLISSSMRAGYGLNQAMSAVATEAATPTSEEFTRVVAETRVGRDLDQSLRGVAERMRNDDFAWVADAIEIQSRVGGNLAEILDTVGNTLRERSQIRRQIHALSAEGRMSAVILIALPFGLAGIISVVNPGYLDPLVQTLTGRIMLGVGVFLMIMGTIWIRRIVRLVF